MSGDGRRITGPGGVQTLFEMSPTEKVAPQPAPTMRAVADPGVVAQHGTNRRGGANGRLQSEAVARAALGEPPRHAGAELLWPCPNHDDKHPSLSVNPSKNVWICGPCGMSGNAWQLAAFLAKLSADDKPAVKQWLTDHGLLLKGSSDTGKRGGNPVARYTYCDADGKPLARKSRYEPKSFSWERWENGKWIKGLWGIKPPLYRLPEIQKSQWAILVEGEKDADNGAGIGFPTTTSGAAKSWQAEHADVLRGKDVVVIADADDSGRTHAQSIAASLYGKATSLKVLELPGAKDLSNWLERGGTAESLHSLIDAAPKWKGEQGDTLLDALVVFIKRFISLSESQAQVTALWIAHTHAFEAADCTPYLHVSSPEKQSGKTQLLEVCRLLVANPWFTGRVTAAVLPRRIEAECPTLLLDESDSAFGGEKEYAEALRGVLNSGYRRGGFTSCCVGQGANISYKDFSTFCPKAIAGIGKLPDTVADRAIPIRLKRAPRRQVEPFRSRDVEPEAGGIKAKVGAWCALNLERLRQARPTLPPELSDRQADVSEPLAAIADAAGGDWGERARRALIELCTKAQAADDSIGVQLLADIRDIFKQTETDRLPSAELTEALTKIETSPWAEWSHGKGLTPPRLARLLRPFEIVPRTIRSGNSTPKGYLRDEFLDAFERYLRADESAPLPRLSNRNTATSQCLYGSGRLFKAQHGEWCGGSKSG